MIEKQAGILRMPENDLNRIDYILQDNRTESIRSFNLTKEVLFNYKNKYVGIAIQYKDNDLFCEEGFLNTYNGLWMINGICIDHKIWDYEGKLLTIIVDDMEEES